MRVRVRNFDQQGCSVLVKHKLLLVKKVQNTAQWPKRSGSQLGTQGSRLSQRQRV
jgi:hypothetical protein